MEYSTGHIDYLARSYLDQHNGLVAGKIADQDIHFPIKNSIHLLQVKGIGKTWSESGLNRQADNHPYRQMLDILAGCFGARTPVAFLLQETASGVQICLGTFSDADSVRGNAKNGYESSIQFLSRSLEAQYPGIALDNAPEKCESLLGLVHQSRYFGLLTGIPTIKTPNEENGWCQIDRLIRAMSGLEWGILVLANPVSALKVSEWMHAATNEMRQIENAEQTKVRRAPLAEQYYKLLELLEKEFYQGLAAGLWNTSFYYFSPQANSLNCLGASLCSCFGGEASQPEPIRAIEYPDLARVVAGLGQLQTKLDPAPGYFQYPYRFQTLLNSVRLSTLVSLPRVEVPGYYVWESASFDVFSHVPPDPKNVQVGEILDQNRRTHCTYQVPVSELTRHCLLVGITGSGKTNTAFHLLQQLWCDKQQIPFLIIEPAKREYRRLARLLGPNKNLRIFTIGEEYLAPFRLNPFEIRPGVSVQTHIDLLKSVFNASFGMWTPLPQILERAIHEIYTDKGWDTTYSTNQRLGTVANFENLLSHTNIYPTLTDLFYKVAELVPKLGYDTEVTRNVKTALETRINNLRIGAKGLMLDTQRSIPIETLLGQPTILELEGVGDDEEKAFIMGLILISLYEYYRCAKIGDSPDKLRHITVIEEAHRLLSNVPNSSNPEASNLRAKAVETFVNMLSEVRAYGEGFMILEQIPTKLAPDVIKNTSLKIMHRVVANDDRQEMGGVMNLNAKQIRKVVALGTGEVVVHGGGKYADDNPILVKVPYSKSEEDKPLGDSEIRSIWKQFCDHTGLAPIFLTYPACQTHCNPVNLKCGSAKRIAEISAVKDAFSAFILSLVLSAKVLKNQDICSLFCNLYAEIAAVIRTYLPYGEEESIQRHCVLTHALHHYMDERGQQYGWSYQDTERMTAHILPALLATSENQSLSGEVKRELETFCQEYIRQCQRVGPFYGCLEACEGYCFFRYAIEPLAQVPDLQKEFQRIALGNDNDENLASLSNIAADQVILPSVNNDTFRRSVALCYAIHQAAVWQDAGWTRKHHLINRLITHYEK